MPPSCFKMVRAFARGLRRYYMDAAERLIAGPLQKCRMDAKLDRWTAALKPFMARDTELGQCEYLAYSGSILHGVHRYNMLTLVSITYMHVPLCKRQW